MISILLWWHLNQRIRQRRFSKETITFGYLVIYGQWALWPGFFVYIAVSPSALPDLRLEPLLTGATLCGLVWLLSLFRLYRARWDPTLRTPDPEHSHPDILPAPVYVMPLAFANARLLWIGAFLINQLVTGWLSIPLFIVCMAWIIWDWRKPKKKPNISAKA